MKSTPESDIVLEKVSAIVNKTDKSTCIVDRVFIFFEFKSIIFYAFWAKKGTFSKSCEIKIS